MGPLAINHPLPTLPLLITDQEGDIVCNLRCPPPSCSVKRQEDDLRVTFGLGSGADVKGFPSRCGVYLHHCSAIELDFLGLDRFEVAARSWDPAKEDALCAKLQLLGARWWPSLEEHSGAEMRKMM
ncbi:hypothetical protein L209DRAFT_748087 [Thermothelomyces heterothallicus CBS 203.75]